MPPRPELAIDHGRLTGATAVLNDEFNCRSRWSDARERCAELDFIVTGEHTLDRAYKAPSLRNVAERAPYMDAGQFATLAEVLDHYNRAPTAAIGHSELRPLRLKPAELRQLEAFLRDAERPHRYQRTRCGKADAMIRTVDLVIVGDGGAARAAAVDALRRSRRVLIVLRSGDMRVGRRLRRCVRNTAGADPVSLR